MKWFNRVHNAVLADWTLKNSYIHCVGIVSISFREWTQNKYNLYLVCYIKQPAMDFDLYITEKADTEHNSYCWKLQKKCIFASENAVRFTYTKCLPDQLLWSYKSINRSGKNYRRWINKTMAKKTHMLQGFQWKTPNC